jgi:hypothetical protein
LLLLRPDAEDKIELMNNLLKPAIVEYKFVMINLPSMSISISDLKIIKCPLSNARMEIADIAKEACVSPKTARRRMEKMRQHHIIDFSINTLHVFYEFSGYIGFLLMVAVNSTSHRV